MNTTSITFRKSNPSYTVLGQNPSSAQERGEEISIILLQRGSGFQRKEYFQQLFDNGYQHVVSLEWNTQAYDREQLCSRFPGLQFMVFQEDNIPLGQALNLAFEQVKNQFLYVLWSDMQAQALHPSAYDSLIETKALVQVPHIRDNKGANIPSLVTPARDGESLRVLFLQSKKDLESSLYPFDYMGVFRRERFLQLGGFDEFFSSEFWQKMDFGYRAYLWGEQIVLNSKLRVEAQQELEIEDMTVKSCYRRFYLKNLAISFLSDHAKLSSKRFFPYWRKSGLNYFKAKKEFKSIQDWVESQKYRYKSDATYVTELWGETGDF
jgi:hypothetical protein